jgi:iron-sulfur cluster insertion protein
VRDAGSSRAEGQRTGEYQKAATLPLATEVERAYTRPASLDDGAPVDVEGAEATHPMISITTLAADKVKEISKSEGLEGQGLRLRVVGGGCAGFQYDLYFEDKPTDLDEQFESHGVKLFVDPLSYQYLDGTEIDYVEGSHGSGFKFGNPNVSGTCGCGSSFQA